MREQFLKRLCMLLAFLLIAVLSINVDLASAQCQSDQKVLLLDLKRGLRFDQNRSSSKLRSWDSGEDCCNWEGVRCDNGGLGHVVGLDLSNESISGWTPAGIFNLRYLQNLSLAFNNFNTTIPSTLANLTELVYLNLSNSGFISEVPTQLLEMKKLATLDLSVSGLYANSKGNGKRLEIPNLESLVRSLELTELHLDGISLSEGEKNWTQILSSSLPNLKVLSLSHCNLSGSIDASLKNLKNLTSIDLSGNNFSAAIPDIFSSFSNLTVLRLSDCSLNGNFTDTVLQIPSLETLDLSSNKHLNVSFPEFSQNQPLKNLFLSDTSILGNLPQSIGFLKNLARVEMARCNLTGPIPSTMSNLTQLISLDLSFNKLTGGVPSLHKSANLTYLDLSQNQLSGEIPSSYLKGVKSLIKVDLSYNQFSGAIPKSMFEIPSLQQIQLSFNKFEGQIPEFSSAFTPKLLNVLDLSSNNLVGPIPSSVSSLSLLKILSLSSNKLNGSIQLDWVRKLANLTSLDLSHNSLTVEVMRNAPNLSSFPQFTTLKLASCNLKEFPDLGNQSKLYYLDLSDNSIPDARPLLGMSAVGSLQYLNLSLNLLRSLPKLADFHTLSILDVHGNQLQDKIPLPPPQVFYVDYSDNDFSSSIPPEIGFSMNFTIFFSLASNSVSGIIPESICNASYLQVVNLSKNRLNGTIPSCLTGGNSNLGVLNLGKNLLNGTIPDNFPEDCGLQTLDLSSNWLYGKVPRSLAKCRTLEVLDLGNNGIQDEFPCALIEYMHDLRVLILRNNHFYGKVGCPDIQTNWQMLQIVDLAHNQFNGILPEQTLLTWKAMMKGGDGSHDRIKYKTLRLSSLYYQDSVTVTSKGVQSEQVKILNYFTYIDFSCNQLEGQLPEAIGDFRGLYLLNLSHNSFSGQILPNIGNLSQLESLDVSANSFSGEIPQQLAALTFLSFLNMSDNNLTGEIPKGTQLQTFLPSSFEGNAGLCGLPLPSSCKDTGDQSAAPPRAAHQNSGLNWHFLLSRVGFGMGFGIGATAFVMALIYSEGLNRWCDHRADKIRMMLVSQR